MRCFTRPTHRPRHAASGVSIRSKPVRPRKATAKLWPTTWARSRGRPNSAGERAATVSITPPRSLQTAETVVDRKGVKHGGNGGRLCFARTQLGQGDVPMSARAMDVGGRLDRSFSSNVVGNPRTQ